MLAHRSEFYSVVSMCYPLYSSATPCAFLLVPLLWLVISWFSCHLYFIDIILCFPCLLSSHGLFTALMLHTGVCGVCVTLTLCVYIHSYMCVCMCVYICTHELKSRLNIWEKECICLYKSDLLCFTCFLDHSFSWRCHDFIFLYSWINSSVYYCIVSTYLTMDF